MPGEYLTINWVTNIETSNERLDVFKIGYPLDSTRATQHSDKNKLEVYIDKIWEDTRNFENFVEGLQVVYLTEILCMNYHNDKLQLVGEKRYIKFTDLLCMKTMQRGNNCYFLRGAKIAYKSQYTINYNVRNDE